MPRRFSIEAVSNRIDTYKPEGQVVGHCGLIHGLNQRPSELEALVRVLLGVGIECDVLTLEGHRPAEWKLFSTIKKEIWHKETDAFISAVAMKAYNAKREYSLLGYSLGGALIAHRLCRREFIKRPSKLFFFAPAWEITRVARSVRPIMPVVPWLPSLAPVHIRAHRRGTPGKAYLALYGTIDELHTPWPSWLINTPGSVFMDPKDELVCSEGVRTFIRAHHLGYEYAEVYVDKKVGGPNHHLITSPKTLTTESWARIVEALTDDPSKLSSIEL